MGNYVVIGAGSVGRETARLLTEEGHEVVVVSRNAGNLDLGPIKTVSADASDSGQLIRVSGDADAIFMCAMAAYHRWPTDFFPILDGAVQAAEAVGARILMAGNTYSYGKNTQGPLTPDLPLEPTTRKGTVRAIMWERARRSKVPAIEVRSSDYLGSDGITLLSAITLPALLDGRPVGFVGSVDVPHSWSHPRDVARTLAAASRYGGEWDRAFMVPAQTATAREVITKIADLLGIKIPDVKVLTPSELTAMGAYEAIEISYLYEQATLVDASDTEKLLSIGGSSLDRMIRDTVGGLQ